MVVGQAPAEPNARVFVGRQRQLDTLRSILASGNRSPQPILIRGDAGIGKTALLHEVLDRACDDGIRVVRGSCPSTRDLGSYTPFPEVLEELDGLPIQRMVRAFSEQDWRNLDSDAAGRRAQLLRSLRDRIADQLGMERTVLSIEDIHWAPAPSLQLLTNLIALRMPNVVIVCTQRTDEPFDSDTADHLDQIARRSSITPLEGFNPAEVREFVWRLGLLHELTQDEWAALGSWTKGNPLLVRELMTHLHESGLLTRHSLREAIIRLRQPVPLTYVVQLRLDSLPAEVLKTLGACAMAGTEFSLEQASAARGTSSARIEEHLLAATEARIVEPSDRLDGDGYRFSHEAYAVAARERSSSDERRLVHRRLAEYGDSHAMSTHEQAHHFALGYASRGGSRAITACRRAAEEAESMLAFESAARFWEYAIRCSSGEASAEQAERWTRLGWASWAARKWDAAQRAWETAIRIHEQLSNGEEVPELALALAEMSRWRQDLTTARCWINKVLQVPELEPRVRARALALMGSTLCLEDAPDGRKHLDEARELIESGVREPLVFYWLSRGYVNLGESSLASALVESGLAEAIRRKDPTATVLFSASVVQHAVSRLDLDGAKKHVRLVEKFADPADATALSYAMGCRVFTYSLLGEWKRVTSICEEWMANLRLAGAYQVATARSFWAEAQFALGKAQAAREAMATAIPHLEHMRAVGLLSLARYMIADGNVEEANALVREVAPAVLERSYSLGGLASLADIASYIEEPDLWRICYERLRSEERPVVLAYTPISVERVLGQLAGRTRRWRAAADHFESAATSLERAGARWELARTYQAYAEMERIRRVRGATQRANALDLKAHRLLSDLGLNGNEPSPHARGGANRYGITSRELEVLELAAEGQRNHEIAQSLTLSVRTVERHFANIFVKVDAANRAEAVMKAAQEGLLSLGLSTPPTTAEIRRPAKTP